MALGKWTPSAKLGLVAIALFGVYLYVTSGERSAPGGVLVALAAPGLDDIKRKVATDAVAQYEMTKRGGSQVDRCVHAGLAAAAFLQAQDEASYRTWKATESAECAAAGVPGH